MRILEYYSKSMPQWLRFLFDVGRVTQYELAAYPGLSVAECTFIDVPNPQDVHSMNDLAKYFPNGELAACVLFGAYDDEDTGELDETSLRVNFGSDRFLNNFPFDHLCIALLSMDVAKKHADRKELQYNKKERDHQLAKNIEADEFSGRVIPTRMYDLDKSGYKDRGMLNNMTKQMYIEKIDEPHRKLLFELTEKALDGLKGCDEVYISLANNCYTEGIKQLDMGKRSIDRMSDDAKGIRIKTIQATLSKVKEKEQILLKLIENSDKLKSIS